MAPKPDKIVSIVPPGGDPDWKVAVIGNYVVDITGATDGQVLTIQPDGSVAAEDPFDLDAMRFKGVVDASANPNYPAAEAGDLYRVSVAGKIGGASGTVVEVGDLFFAIADNAGGTQAAVGTSWSVEQGNINGAVVGPASVTDDLPAVFDGTTGKLIKQKTYAAFKTLLSLVKGDVGLGNVDNTSDANKPVSTAQQAALDLKANLASPSLTGNPTAPTASPGDADTSIATTGFVAAAVTAATLGLFDDRGGYDASVNTFPAAGGSGTAGAVLKGDVWTVTVAGTLGGVAVVAGDLVRALADAPGQTAGNWSVAEHNLGYVPENVANKDTDGTLAANSDTKYASQKAVKTYADTKAPLASPALTGNPTAPTPTLGDNDTSIATTAFVQTAAGLLIPKTTLDANSVLIAVTDDTPVALPMAASTILARLASGDVVAATPNDIRELAAVTPHRLLTVGQETMPRFFASSNHSMGTGIFRVTYFTARKSQTTTQMRVFCTTGYVGTPTLVRFGLYSVAGNGDLTLIASTANDTALLAANQAYTKAWQASVALVAGTVYAFGELVVTVGTAPNIGGGGTSIGNEFAIAPRISGSLSAQTDLPASPTEASLGATGVTAYAAILP